ncbi:MAG: hypothetical protein ABI629_12025 [bacterium]
MAPGRQVTIGEVVRAVSIALGNLPVTACAAADVNHDRVVDIGELIAAVNAAIGGCPA